MSNTQAGPLTIAPPPEAADPAPRLTHARPYSIEHRAVPQEITQPGWSRLRCIGFRFALIYIVLYCLPFPLNALPVGEIFGPQIGATYFQWTQSYDQLWQKVVPWVGQQVFNVEITVFPNGSGDTTFNYVQVLVYLVIAVLGTLLWTAADRRSAGYPGLHKWLRVYVRYVLALAMLGYGFAKIVPGQFPPPGPERLMQTYGSSSPMGLLWTFMGASAAYTFFAGFMECLGGLLLFPRRTATLGAMIVSGVMLNVVLLNFCYDVPVKLYSMHLLLMATWLVLPDVPALMSVLVRTRAVPAAPVQPLFASPWLNVPALVVKLAFVAFTLYGGVQQTIALHQQMNDKSTLSPLAGIYEVESFTRKAATNAPATTNPAAEDASRWKRVVISDYKQILVLAVQQADDQMPRFRVTDDPTAKAISLALRSDPSKASTLKYDMPEADVLTLTGEFMGQNIDVRLRKADANQWLLTNRGFHWINEYPFNR